MCDRAFVPLPTAAHAGLACSRLPQTMIINSNCKHLRKSTYVFGLLCSHMATLRSDKDGSVYRDLYSPQRC